LKAADPEFHDGGPGKVSMPVHSSFYECPARGMKRVYIDGKVVSYRPNK